jgi:hypothetical protein
MSIQDFEEGFEEDVERKMEFGFLDRKGETFNGRKQSRGNSTR